MSKICIFIPHHKNPKLLPPLFHSLLEMEGNQRDVTIVLVDNHSQDRSVDLTKKKFPEISIFSLEKNEGFAPALNKAVNAYEADWVCFLNNDVHVEPDWLKNMVKAAEQIDAPCFASHIMDWAGQNTQFAGGWINLFGKGFENQVLDHEQPYEVFFACGCGMMIRRDVFLKTGGFDSDYFMLYEDVDLGWRLRLLGYSIFFVPEARVMHHAHASLAKESYATKAVFYERNSLATIYKNLDTQNMRRILPLAVRESLLRAKAVSGIGLPFRYSPEGMAMRNTVSEFMTHLDGWKAKREFVQSRRTVSDQEIFTRFFPKPTQIWCYTEAHYERVAHPFIKPQIETCFEMARDTAMGY